MNYRRLLILTAFTVSLCSVPAWAQRQQQQHVDLTIRIFPENTRTLPNSLKVELLTGSRMPITMTYARDEGTVTFNRLDPGSYRVIVSSPDLEEPREISFVINRNQTMHLETMSVRVKAPVENTSTQGSISAASLNIPSKAAQEFDKGLEAFNKKETDKAKIRFSKAVELYPRYAAAYNNLGVISMQAGNLLEGEDFFRKAVHADEHYAPPYLNLAKAIMPQNKNQEAIELLVKASSLDPLNAEILSILAMLELQTGSHSKAAANARKAHNVAHERFAVCHFIAGRALEAQNLPLQALEEYKMFLKEAPDSPSAPKVRSAMAALEKPQP